MTPPETIGPATKTWMTIAHTQANSTIREEVAAFATHMESKLRENDYKGGWKNDGLGSLVNRAVEELQELQRAVGAFEHVRYSPSTTAEDLKAAAREVLREAADVANFAMMIADNADRIAR
jgi:NTP pyrophosphatase (non-canonical NTP hydrolase)